MKIRVKKSLFLAAFFFFDPLKIAQKWVFRGASFFSLAPFFPLFLMRASVFCQNNSWSKKIIEIRFEEQSLYIA